MQKQDLSKLQLRKLRAFKRPTSSDKNGEQNEDEEDHVEINEENHKKLKTQE
jgi:hypothetical protein